MPAQTMPKAMCKYAMQFFLLIPFFSLFFSFLDLPFQGAAVRENCFKIYKQLRAIPKIALLFEH